MFIGGVLLTLTSLAGCGGGTTDPVATPCPDGATVGTTDAFEGGPADFCYLADGTPHGWFIQRWGDSGLPKTEGQYCVGVPCGEWRHYCDDGSLDLIERFDSSGVPCGDWETYNCGEVAVDVEQSPPCPEE